MNKKIIAGLVALIAGAGAEQANATAYAVTADTSVYQFLGNLASYGYTDLYALNTGAASPHSMVSVLNFSSLNSALSSLTPGSYTATLNLYSSCAVGGFVSGCPGEAAAGGGIASLTTDIFTQNAAWTETGALPWANVVTGTKYGSFTTSTANPGWISVDVTALVQYWGTLGSTGNGIVLSEQAYSPVKGTSNNFIVQALGSKESGYGAYIDVQAVPVPAAAWLFGSAVLGLGGVSRRRKTQA